MSEIIHPYKHYHRTTLWHIFHHYTEVIPSTEGMLMLDPSPSTSMDISLAERLLNIFHEMYNFEQSHVPLEKRPNDGIWEMVKHEFHGEVYRLLVDKDVLGFAKYMSNAYRMPLTYGLGGSASVFDAITNPTGDAYQANVLILLDRLAALAEAVGAIPYENPEQGSYGVNVCKPVDELVDAIQSKLGVEIYRPPVMGLFGLEYRGNIIDFRAIEDAYGIYRLQTLGYETPIDRVAEIGGGIGGTAFQAIRAGISQYTIFDLPIICLVQGYFLMKIYGGDAVKFFGEPIPDRAINILPYWEFFNRDRTFDAVFNRDSLPEIPRARAEEYLQEISDRRVPLISINQESQALAGRKDLCQLNVNSLALNFPGLRCSSRHPYWLRKGYVEEIYRPVR